MASQNSSLAYDLSAYQPERELKKSKPQMRVVTNRNSYAASLLNARAISAFLVVVALMSLMLYNQVQLTEINGQINTLNEELQLLEYENVKMSSELESTMSLRTIGEQARIRLGMQPVESSQVVYMYIEQEDKVERTENSPNQPVTQSIKDAVIGVITRIQEYIQAE